MGRANLGSFRHVVNGRRAGRSRAAARAYTGVGGSVAVPVPLAVVVVAQPLALVLARPCCASTRLGASAKTRRVSGALLPIGSFARRCRLSVKALRHYDDLGLLRPARVDVATGYRYYDRRQAPAAIAIALLRSLDVALPAIRELLASDDPGALARVLDPRARAPGARDRAGRDRRCARSSA